MPRELFHKGVKSEGYSTEGDEWIPRGFLLMHIVVVHSKAIRVSKKSKGKVAGFQKHVLLTGMVYDQSLEVTDKITWTMLLAFLTFKAID